MNGKKNHPEANSIITYCDGRQIWAEEEPDYIADEIVARKGLNILINTFDDDGQKKEQFLDIHGISSIHPLR